MERRRLRFDCDRMRLLPCLLVFALLDLLLFLLVPFENDARVSNL